MVAIRVLLVDDHPVVREGLRRMLQRETDLEVVGEAGNGEEALTLAESLSPDVALVDIKMPGMNGVEAVRRLKEQNPALEAIVVTLYGEQYLGQAIEAGAVGYLPKDFTREELLEAIRAVRAGKAAIHPSLSRDLLSEFATLARGSLGPHTLTPRQLEVLRMVSQGATNKQIGDRLFLSETTVRREVRRIFEKLVVRDRSEAVAEAYRRCIL